MMDDHLQSSDPVSPEKTSSLSNDYSERKKQKLTVSFAVDESQSDVPERQHTPVDDIWGEVDDLSKEAEYEKLERRIERTLCSD